VAIAASTSANRLARSRANPLGTAVLAEFAAVEQPVDVRTETGCAQQQGVSGTEAG
jgi:hypothetical protein